MVVMEFHDVLRTMVKENASDLFIKINTPPAIRVNGRINFVGEEKLTKEGIQSVFDTITNSYTREVFRDEHEVDLAYELEGVGRFRVNCMLQKASVSFVFRHVKSVLPTFEDLGLPGEGLKSLTQKLRGLVLVTGITGSGKSTTLAAMLEHINETEQRHIITIEDPIEYVYSDKKSIVNQREIGVDTRSFSSALKHCMRQSPDVILIGEMRDKETMEAAINAAETGHLVFSTLHSTNASQTVERMINYFPPHQHNLIRMQLSMLLEGVISQRLLRRLDGRGRVPAVELMLATPTIKELLYEGKTLQLYSAIRDGSVHYKSQTFNQSLLGLYQGGMITKEDALANADNPDEMLLEFRGIVRGAKSSDFDFDEQEAGRGGKGVVNFSSNNAKAPASPAPFGGGEPEPKAPPKIQRGTKMDDLDFS